MKRRQGGEDTHVMLSLPRTPTAMTAVSGSGPLCGSGARAAPAAARHRGGMSPVRPQQMSDTVI